MKYMTRRNEMRFLRAGRWALVAGLLVSLWPAAGWCAMPPQPAILRFDFGTADSQVYTNFMPVTEKTVFTNELGYGWGGAQNISSANRQGPDALFRDWVASSPPFEIALPDGQYSVWLVVGDNDNYPRGFTVTQKNTAGQVETLLTKKVEFQDWWDWYFALQDIEWDDVQSLWDTYVEHKFKSYTLHVKVTGGRMRLALGGVPVCCLVVYPQALETEAKIVLEQMRAAQRAEFDRLYKLKAPNPFIAPELIGPEARRDGLFLVGRNYLQSEESADAYTPRNTTNALEGFAALGQYEALTPAILPLRDFPSAKLTISDLKGPSGAILPASAIEIGCQRYAIWPNSPLGTGSHIVPRDIVPRNTVRLHASMPQRFWLTIKVPADARPGDYSGTVMVTAGQSRSELPVHFKVLPFQLDPASHVARGPFYYFPSETGDRFWEVVENDFKFLAEHSMNSVPEFPAWYDVLTRDGQPNPKWAEEMDKFVALYRKYNFSGPVPPYSMINIARWSGLPPIEKPDEPVSAETRKRLTDYISTLKVEEKKRGWPEIVFYVSDELSNEGAAGAKWGVRYLKLLDEIRKQVPGGFRTCASMDGVPELVMVPLLDFPMPNAGCVPGNEYIDSIRKAGHQLWLYNGTGFSRFGFGFFVWRTGATGRYVWHFDFRSYNPTSCPYNAFDYWIGTKYIFGYATRQGVRRATPDSERAREGIDDLRYLVTLEKAIARNSGKPEAKKAREWLAWLCNGIDVNLSHYNEYGDWHWSVYDKLRWQAAEQIMKLQGRPIL